MSKGLVIKSTGSWIEVKDDETKQIISCKIKGKFRIKGIKNTNPVTVGDRVGFEYSPSEKSGIINEIEERKNYIIRRSSNLSKQAQIIAANIDQALLIVTLTCPETNIEFIDRFLVTAEAYNIPVKLIFNKIDLYSEELKEYHKALKLIYENIGYPCYELSVTENINVDRVHDLLLNKISLLAGNSGVGKSSLINAVDPDLHLKVAEISEAHLSGKHTTTYSEMFELTEGGYIIDTPGIKGFGVIDLKKEELYHYFPEFFKLSEACQYYNCTHTHEPGCAVKEAMEKGIISPSRYRSYLSLFFEEENKYRF
ncbi:MAG: ribosome small subunit-dependent GTPase A [Bacteroidota bacterium]|nr:ribosome small subunit-dependent GTPase A [Bacteroidota bacterium]